MVVVKGGADLPQAVMAAAGQGGQVRGSQLRSRRSSSASDSASSGALAESGVIDSGWLAPGWGITTGALASIRGQGHLLRRNAAGVGHLLEGGVLVAASWPCGADAAERAEGQERDTVLPRRCRRLRGSLVRNLGENFRFLHTRRRLPRTEHATGDVDLLDAGVGDARHPDLARVEQLFQRTDRLLIRHGRVGPVELVQADGASTPSALSARDASTACCRCASKRPIQRPRTVTRPQVTALGGDQDLQPACRRHR